MNWTAPVKHKKVMVPDRLLKASVDLNSCGTPEKYGSLKWQIKIADETMLKTDRKNASSKTLTFFVVSKSFVTPWRIVPMI